jgi:Zn-finger nucleic acid-binding protein
MQCPIDQTELVMSDRQGVEIDYCPKCRGVWLDRGELDKIIDRAADPAASRPEARQTTVTSAADSRGSSSGIFGKVSDSLKDNDRDRDKDEYDSHGRKKKKRGGFLEDLFDF